jgi:hypothetical protein
MDIEAISGAATVALASAIFFVLVAKSWAVLSRSVDFRTSFKDSIMREAAQRFRDEFERLSCAQSIYLGAILVFIVLFATAYALRARELFAGYPAWQLNLQLVFLALALCFAVYRLSDTMFTRRKIGLLRDANLAVGHQLQQISAGGARVFHDVATSTGVVDHVVVGQSGIYAVNVMARRPSRNGEVRLTGNELRYSTSKTPASIIPLTARNARLEKEFTELLGHKVRVRSVIAVPGWEVGEQASHNHLLVNERTIGMMRGWKDRSDYLMNEDVDALQRNLTARCRRSSRSKPKR